MLYTIWNIVIDLSTPICFTLAAITAPYLGQIIVGNNNFYIFVFDTFNNFITVLSITASDSLTIHWKSQIQWPAAPCSPSYSVSTTNEDSTLIYSSKIILKHKVLYLRL